MKERALCMIAIELARYTDSVRSVNYNYVGCLDILIILGTLYSTFAGIPINPVWWVCGYPSCCQVLLFLHAAVNVDGSSHVFQS